MTNTFVIDASTCLKWIFLDETNSKKALILQNKFLDRRIELIAPNIWVFEIANSIKTAFLQNRFPAGKCRIKLDQLLKSSPYLVNIEDKIDLCLKNALDYSISVYDSAYVTLGILNDIPLISADEKLVRKIRDPKIALNLKDYTLH